jgi:hypothetical protein
LLPTIQQTFENTVTFENFYKECYWQKRNDESSSNDAYDSIVTSSRWKVNSRKNAGSARRLADAILKNKLKIICLTILKTYFYVYVHK